MLAGLLLLPLGLLLFASGLVVGLRWRADERTAPNTSEPVREAPATSAPAVTETAAPAEADLGVEERARADAPPVTPPAVAAGRPVYLALVIDDLGRRVEDVDAIAALGVDVSYAVLPFEIRTREVLERLEAGGREVLVHLPMEPDGDADPGPGALRRGMSARELAALTASALDAVPGAVGVNNHMGSALSADDAAMKVILREIGERGMFYLDSRTSAGSVGFELARRSGMAAARRDVFLDGVLEPDAIREQFRRLLAVGRDAGAAVAIGHPHPQTIAVLREEVPAALALGYRFVPVSYLLERTGGE